MREQRKPKGTMDFPRRIAQQKRCKAGWTISKPTSEQGMADPRWRKRRRMRAKDRATQKGLEKWRQTTSHPELSRMAMHRTRFSGSLKQKRRKTWRGNLMAGRSRMECLGHLKRKKRNRQTRLLRFQDPLKRKKRNRQTHLSRFQDLLKRKRKNWPSEVRAVPHRTRFQESPMRKRKNEGRH
jgi:hypothetical protein